jgi:hypothetical protein
MCILLLLGNGSVKDITAGTVEAEVEVTLEREPSSSLPLSSCFLHAHCSVCHLPHAVLFLGPFVDHEVADFQRTSVQLAYLEVTVQEKLRSG